jgi:hypothetical protein
MLDVININRCQNKGVCCSRSSLHVGCGKMSIDGAPLDLKKCLAEVPKTLQLYLLRNLESHLGKEH